MGRVIIDSMCKDELNSDTKIFHTQPTRITRIAKGSGRSESEVNELLTMFKPLQKIAQIFVKKNFNLENMIQSFTSLASWTLKKGKDIRAPRARGSAPLGRERRRGPSGPWDPRVGIWLLFKTGLET